MKRETLLARVEPELRRRERNVRAAIVREACAAGAGGVVGASAGQKAFDIFDMPRKKAGASASAHSELEEWAPTALSRPSSLVSG